MSSTRNYGKRGFSRYWRALSDWTPRRRARPRAKISDDEFKDSRWEIGRAQWRFHGNWGCESDADESKRIWCRPNPSRFEGDGCMKPRY